MRTFLWVLAATVTGAVLGFPFVFLLSILEVDLDYHLWLPVSPLAGAVVGLVIGAGVAVSLRVRQNHH